MGDIADYYLEQEIMFGDLAEEYDGNAKVRTVTCRCCGQSGLLWMQEENKKWRLYDGIFRHNCPVNPL